MLVGTPPSLSNEQYSLENPMTTGSPSSAAAAATPAEHFIDYECCVCRLTKSDSESPIGLIGTSCLSLCKFDEQRNKLTKICL